MDLTYLRKQSDFVSDLSLKDLAKVRGMALLRPFCGAVFDWSFVRINSEALSALDKSVNPDAPLMAENDFNFGPSPEFADMVVQGGGCIKDYIALIPLHKRSLARVDFDIPPRSGAVLVRVHSDNWFESLARVVRHASTADFFDGFKAAALSLPHRSLAQFLFWELCVRKSEFVRSGRKVYDWPSDSPSLVFAADKDAAAELLENSFGDKSIALAIGALNVSEWIFANEFAKSFLGENLKPGKLVPKDIISGWKNDG
ncbi:MAG: hypothetical protein LBH81_01910 [Rickettsiales bacterium]|jgi:hypothetical protein|nr:hypothetical protein [Rickettsiales bacterium]